jgi:L-methionine (R)-S-oxide reductase
MNPPRHKAALTRITAETGVETDPQRILERVVAALKEGIPEYTWVGVYLLEGDELVLGPFLGKPSPHTRIPLGQGICGAAATEKATIIVDDVNADARYLACSIETKSEIVVPIMDGARVLGEIDIDSDRPAAFGNADRELLESVAALIAPRLVRLRALKS